MVNLNVLVRDEVKETLEIVARKEDIPVSILVRRILSQWTIQQLSADRREDRGKTQGS